MRDRINVSHRWCAAAAASRAAVVLLGGAVVTPAAFPTAAAARPVPKPETAAVASSEKVPPGAGAAAATLQKNGDRRLRKGELAEAARDFVRAALAAPGDPVYRLTAGVALATIGDVRAAASQFRHAQRLADDDVVAALLLQGALSEQGLAGPAQTVGLDTIRRFTLEGKAGLDASGSIARLKAAVARFPDSAVVHLLLGDAYQISGQWKDAERMYDRAAALAPEWSKPHVNRGVLRMAQGRPREAIASFEAALSRDPGNGQVRLWKGDAQLKMGRAGEALRTYRSIENQPRVAAQATTRIGQIYLEGQQLDAALKAFNRAQDLAPQDPEPVAGIAEAQVSAGNYGAAAEAYHRALRLTKSGGLISTRPILYRALAEAQLSARDPDAAARTLERALAEEPQNAPLWHRLRAQAFFDKGDGRAGEAALRDALDAETGRYPLETLHAIAARNLLGRIGHACRAELAGPRRADALAVLAHLARYGGQADEEIRLRQQVTELRDQGVDHLLLANAYEQTGQAQKARDAYRRALALGGLSEPDQDRARLRLRQLTAPTTSPAGSRKR